MTQKFGGDYLKFRARISKKSGIQVENIDVNLIDCLAFEAETGIVPFKGVAASRRNELLK